MLDIVVLASGRGSNLAALIAARDAGTLPLVKVLEGGTWAAGRRIARERRPDGAPPLAIVSDGTVF
jgi:folate-dependent phosphoribosylglycinamide formyltransferase PurN